MAAPSEHWDGEALHDRIEVDGRMVDVIIARQALIERFELKDASPESMRSASLRYAGHIMQAVARKVRDGAAEPIRIDIRDF